MIQTCNKNLNVRWSIYFSPRQIWTNIASPQDTSCIRESAPGPPHMLLIRCFFFEDPAPPWYWVQWTRNSRFAPSDFIIRISDFIIRIICRINSCKKILSRYICWKCGSWEISWRNDRWTIDFRVPDGDRTRSFVMIGETLWPSSYQDSDEEPRCKFDISATLSWLSLIHFSNWPVLRFYVFKNLHGTCFREIKYQLDLILHIKHF